MAPPPQLTPAQIGEFKAEGYVIARGLIEYDSNAATKIAGRRSEDIAALLGEMPRSVLVHRDHLAMI